MDKKTKIIYGIAIPLALVSFYVLVIKNRVPSLNLEGTFWANNVAVIQFGNNKKFVSLGNDGVMNAGATYSNKYKLRFVSNKNIMEFEVKDRNNNIVNKQTLDFGAKIRY